MFKQVIVSLSIWLSIMKEWFYTVSVTGPLQDKWVPKQICIVVSRPPNVMW